MSRSIQYVRIFGIEHHSSNVIFIQRCINSIVLSVLFIIFPLSPVSLPRTLSLPSFSQDSDLKLRSVIKAHMSLDCIFINHGLQRAWDFSKPESINLTEVGAELNTEYLTPFHLISTFLPFLQKQAIPACLLITSPGLALVPILRKGNYCASTAQCMISHW